MIEIGKWVASNRGKPTSTIRAVKNVWYERAFAHVRHYKRFYIVFSVILVFSVSLVAILPGAVHHGTYQSAIVTIGTAGISSQSRTGATSEGPSTMVSSSQNSLIDPSTSGAPGTVTDTVTSILTTMTDSVPAPTSTNSETCVRSSFAGNASWVGVYNPKVNPPQFQIVGSRDVSGCCHHCFNLQPPRRCNGWGYIKSMCSIVYDYPGEGTTPECPNGRPLVGISFGGGAGDFAGLGPCAMAG
ncbi:hypothetical protein PGQ11_002673 [Apiospora arundinis]|uniref:Uncharacterized protein n=1 Tax=Apiospora arundinis TaxID=335852 RepID=A0ABR2JJB1_9PEZI